MTGELAKRADKAVGIKQTLKALRDGRAQKVYIARDADPELLEPLLKEAQARGVQVEEIAAMKDLGRLCGIQVPAAAAALTEG